MVNQSSPAAAVPVHLAEAIAALKRAKSLTPENSPPWLHLDAAEREASQALAAIQAETGAGSRCGFVEYF